MAYACLYILSRRGEREGSGRKRRKAEEKQRRDGDFRKWVEDAEEMEGNSSDREGGEVWKKEGKLEVGGSK